MSTTQVKRENGHATDGVLRAINEIAISNAQLRSLRERGVQSSTSISSQESRCGQAEKGRARFRTCSRAGPLATAEPVQGGGGPGASTNGSRRRSPFARSAFSGRANAAGDHDPFSAVFARLRKRGSADQVGLGCVFRFCPGAFVP